MKTFENRRHIDIVNDLKEIFDKEYETSMKYSDTIYNGANYAILNLLINYSDKNKYGISIELKVSTLVFKDKSSMTIFAFNYEGKSNDLTQKISHIHTPDSKEDYDITIGKIVDQFNKTIKIFDF